MTIFVTGDTHSDPLPRFKALCRQTEEEGGASLTKEDVVIIAGDFGVIWWDDSTKYKRLEDYTLDKLENMPFTTLFIDGNHENFNRLMRFPVESGYGGKVGVLRPSVLHLRQRGHVYTIDGRKIWCFGGGISVDKNYRSEGISWWSQEEPSTAEYCYGLNQLEKHNWEVDFVVTHAGPSGAVDAMGLPPLRESFGDKVYEYDPVSPYLEHVSRKLRFKKWFFGHYHKDIKEISSVTASSCVSSEEGNFTAMRHYVYELL